MSSLFTTVPFGLTFGTDIHDVLYYRKLASPLARINLAKPVKCGRTCSYARRDRRMPTLTADSSIDVSAKGWKSVRQI
jgi:hypothetical protein